jgi:hypothetical protein
MVHNQALPAKSLSQITLHKIPRTNHTFTTPEADDFAIAHIMRWVEAHGFVR